MAMIRRDNLQHNMVLPLYRGKTCDVPLAGDAALL
jgi:hypothetical protein